MSSRIPVHFLRRRSLLHMLISTGFGFGLAACGGGSRDAEVDQTATLLSSEADAAVAAGLVGLVLGEVNVASSTVVVAGRRRIGQGARVQAEDRFAIGSNTKAMTCAAILAHAERAGLDLTLTLAQAFPNWAGDIHPAFAQVTLADLLNHRAGLPAFDGSGTEEDTFLAAVAADPAPPPQTRMARRAYFTRWLLARAPAAGVEPGSGFLYSNAGYAVAAAVVEAASGTAFETLFEHVLVQPLALQGEWRSMVPGPSDVLWGHEGAAGGLAVVEADAEGLATKDWQDVLAPAGQWACTGAAYAKLLRWHVQALRGDPTPLPRAYVGGLRAASGEQYVWGWQGVTTPHRTLLIHNGHVPGFMAEVVLDRGGDFALFGLSNTGDMAADGTSWVLRRIDRALANVLQRQSIAF